MSALSMGAARGITLEQPTSGFESDSFAEGCNLLGEKTHAWHDGTVVASLSSLRQSRRGPPPPALLLLQTQGLLTLVQMKGMGGHRRYSVLKGNTRRGAWILHFSVISVIYRPRGGLAILLSASNSPSASTTRPVLGVRPLWWRRPF